jgi:hypothetical protein
MNDSRSPCSQTFFEQRHRSFYDNANDLCKYVLLASHPGLVRNYRKPLFELIIDPCRESPKKAEEASEKRAVETDSKRFLEEGNRKDWGARQEVKSGQHEGAEKVLQWHNESILKTAIFAALLFQTQDDQISNQFSV